MSKTAPPHYYWRNAHRTLGLIVIALVGDPVAWAAFIGQSVRRHAHLADGA